MFKYGLDNGLIEKPVRYGPEFKKPDKAVLRRHRAQNGEKMLEADQLRRLIDAAGVPLKAMILLGVNAGFGNPTSPPCPCRPSTWTRVGSNFPRPEDRHRARCPLWPETVAAIREALAERPERRRRRRRGLVFVNLARPALDSLHGRGRSRRQRHHPVHDAC